jgi:hypothetical protein
MLDPIIGGESHRGQSERDGQATGIIDLKCTVWSDHIDDIVRASMSYQDPPARVSGPEAVAERSASEDVDPGDVSPVCLGERLSTPF